MRMLSMLKVKVQENICRVHEAEGGERQKVKPEE